MCDKRNQLTDNISYLIENWREVPVANTKVLMENFPFILPPQEHWDKVVKALKSDGSSSHNHKHHEHEPEISHCYEECFDPTSKEAADWYSDEWESDYDDDDDHDDFYYCEGEAPHYPQHCPSHCAPAPSPAAPAPAPAAPAPAPAAPAPAPCDH